MALYYPDRLESNNPAAYGIVKSIEVAGHKTVASLTELYALADAILSDSGTNTDDDAIGLEWYVISEDRKYKLVDWSNRTSATGWEKVESSDDIIETVGDYTINGHKISENPELDKTDIGLSNVDNTSDIDKPISTSVQEALDELNSSINEIVTEKVNEINDKISGLDLTLYKVVTQLPTEDIEENKIYLVANSVSESGNIFIEYIYVNDAWEELGEFKPEIDLSSYLTIEDAEDTYATQETVNAVAEVIYLQFSSLSLNASSTTIERGVDTTITISWTFTFNSTSTTPDTISVTKSGSTLISDTSTTSITDTINSTTSYSATATYNGVTKTASRTVNAYYPMYFGSSSSTTLTETDILAMTKQSIKSSPSGTYSVSVGQGEYLWLCVPSTMSISSVTSSGFEVPMESYTTVTITDKTDYRCYRSTSSFNEGTVSITVS